MGPLSQGPCPENLSAPKSCDSLRLQRRFLPLPKKNPRSFGVPSAISSAKKIASEPRFLLRGKWVKMVLAAEFPAVPSPAVPSPAVKVASERRCAILVHSAENAKRGGKKEGGETSQGDPPRKTVSDPLHLGTFLPPSPILFLLVSPLEMPRISLS